MIDWTDTRCNLVRLLWGEGQSAGAIAKVLSLDSGEPVSRSAVIGKVHRMRLAKRVNRHLVKRSNRAKLRPPPQPKAKTMIALPLPFPTLEAFIPDPVAVALAAWQPLPGTTPIDLMALDNHTCRWPVTGGFCGVGRPVERSYCDYHHLRAHTRMTTVAQLLQAAE